MTLPRSTLVALFLFALGALGWFFIAGVVRLGVGSTMYGAEARQAVERLMEAPIPEGAEVVAVHLGGFQDPFVQIRIDAAHSRRAAMLAFLRMNEAALLPGWRDIGADRARWWTLPAHNGAFHGNPELPFYHAADLLIVPLSDPAERDAYLIYAWTM